MDLQFWIVKWRVRYGLEIKYGTHQNIDGIKNQESRQDHEKSE